MIETCSWQAENQIFAYIQLECPGSLLEDRVEVGKERLRYRTAALPRRVLAAADHAENTQIEDCTISRSTAAVTDLDIITRVCLLADRSSSTSLAHCVRYSLSPIRICQTHLLMYTDPVSQNGHFVSEQK